MEEYIETNLVESQSNPGFYHTPFSPEILVSPHGAFISLKTNKLITVTYNGDGYPVIHVPGLGTQTVHRIMVETFLKCPGNPQDYHVNHKNGIKTDFTLTNLEWSSPTENIVHSFKTGLRSDNHRIFAKDLETGEIHEFHSQNECARFLGTTAGHIRVFLNRKVRRYPFGERWDIRREDGEWTGFGRSDVGKCSRPSLAMVVTLTDSPRTLTLFENIAHVADHYQVSVDTAKKWLAVGKSDTDDPFSVYLASTYRLMVEDRAILNDMVKVPNPNKRKKPKESYIKNNPIPITVTNTVTGVVDNYPSTEAFAKIVGAERKTIQRSMWRKDGIWRHYLIKYRND